MKKKKVRAGDLIIYAVLLAVMAWFIVPLLFNSKEDLASAASTAEISVNGEHYQTVELTEETQDIEVRTSRGYNLLRVSEHGIEMVEADCPDQLCLGFGHIGHKGQNIVCLPNRIFVEITGPAGSGDEVDAFVS